jgi:hypothetical protein
MKRSMLAIGIILLLALGAQLTLQFSDSLPGFRGGSDCTWCHNDPATAYNPAFADATIDLDGRATESYWSDYQYRRMTVFVDVEVYITLVFTQNETHLFGMAQWNDPTVEGTDQMMYMPADGFSLVWNINMTDFTANYPTGMKTKNAGEAADLWLWKASADSHNAHVGLNTSAGANEYAVITGDMQNLAFNNVGYVDATAGYTLDANATWGYQSTRARSHYTLEFVRPLVTDNVNDVQFDESRYYDFAVAMFYNSSGADHLSSFELSLFVKATGDTENDFINHPVIVQERQTLTEYHTDVVTEQVNVTVTEQEATFQLFSVIVFAAMIPIIALVRRRNN